MNRLAEGYIKVGTWGLNLFLLNLLWIIFSAGGLLVAGVFPATAALIAVLRNLIIRQEDTALFKEFWCQFRRYFVKANLLGYVLTAGGVVLYIDFRIMQHIVTMSIFHIFLLSFLYILIFFYVFTAFYAFPVLVHYHTGVFGCLKYSLIMAAGKPLQSISVAAALLLLVWVFAKIPGLLAVFGISLIFFVVLKMIIHSLGNTQVQKES
ncbi:YesL family protein [Domibacillus enclensis]|uniref:Uncharacterized membrane protein YesL n=1 Tax=Domibacillus enclensis TaxID=1017273 RepID=A0A1N7CYF4_9BACI|nr:DUF624 domain-containing protein [Domibacillus enclensis]OXS73141.1 hypothetical protein B1B05_18835 [Domibacillus enclensis]SIR68495.1 Uncharacterized membrane protein YesL [Domibacillus enclensis]